MGVEIPHEKGRFWGKGSPVVKYRDFLPRAVQKWLNRSICRLGCGLGWAEGSTSSVILANVAPVCPHRRAYWRHLANTTEPFVFIGDEVLCQITLTACYISGLLNISGTTEAVKLESSNVVHGYIKY